MRRRTAWRLVGASVLIGALAAVSVHELQPVPAAAPGLKGDANLLQRADVAAIPVAGGWAQFALDTDPTVICEERLLATLSPTVLSYRKYQTPAGHGPEAPVIRSAVMEFSDDAAASAAYTTLKVWLTTCPATLAADDVRAAGSLSTPTAPGPLSTQMFVGVRQRTVLESSTRPVFDQFVGSSGRRILVVEYSRVLNGDQGEEEFASLVDRAARRAAL